MTLRAVPEGFSGRSIRNLVHKIQSNILTLNSDSVDNRALSIPGRRRQLFGLIVGQDSAHLKPELCPSDP